MPIDRFARYAWGVLAANLLVIMWGAFVRATGSGAGCGSHWPLCNGELIPRADQIETLIEFSHRLTSGVALFMVVGLAIWAFRAYPRGHRVRYAAGLSLFFMLTEALIGAGLVLFEYVATNVSIARAVWMAGHLINTFFLLACLTLTAWWASGGSAIRLRKQGVVVWSLGFAVAGILVLSVSGGITALGDTLVLGAGMSPADSPILARLVSLRIYHPLTAFIVGGLVLTAAWLANVKRPGPATQKLARAVMALYVCQLLLGALNVALKAPVWIQLVHLLLSNLIWITLLLLAASALRITRSVVEQTKPIESPPMAARSGSLL